ncbi:response regulator transcription factor [Paraconexibacter sp.]|uniref:response regulator transcription factor n=1 Tax=Paraconexibacter sp. TaxID=2949640 RepID=UPI0035613DD2
MTLVLVIEDDPDVGRLVTRLMERSGHDVRLCADGEAGLRAFFEQRPDVVVLDIGLPGMDGWQVLERVRELSDVPVLMLTAQGDELDRVRGLRSGADDFVSKPFGRQELAARVDALLRRAALTTTADGRDEGLDVYSDAALTVDHRQRTVVVGGEELRLTPTEFRLLAAFVRNPNQVLSTDQIIDLVWGDPYIQREQVKLIVGRLRKRLDGRVAGETIETVRGFGYRYVAARS